MSNTKIKVSELKKGDEFKNRYGVFKCVEPYQSKYYPAKIVSVDSFVGMEPGTLVGGFKPDSTVELI